MDAAGVVLGDAVGHGRVMLGRRLVEGRLIVLDQGVVLHRRVLEDLERLAGWPQLGGVQPVGVAAGAVLAVGGPLHRLGERPLGPLAGALLLNRQLGKWERLQPLVGDRPAAQDRAAVGACGEAALSPLERLQALVELAGDRLVGLLADPPSAPSVRVPSDLVGGSSAVGRRRPRNPRDTVPIAPLLSSAPGSP